jgi:fatty-acyl-CoA synthase
METTFIIIKNSNLFTRWKTRVSFSDMYKRCKKLANALTSKLGITNGHGGYFCMESCAPCRAIHMAFPFCHTINIRLTNDQTEYIINNSEDKVIFVDATLVPLLEKIAPLETVECYVLINDKKF